MIFDLDLPFVAVHTMSAELCEVQGAGPNDGQRLIALVGVGWAGQTDVPAKVQLALRPEDVRPLARTLLALADRNGLP